MTPKVAKAPKVYSKKMEKKGAAMYEPIKTGVFGMDKRENRIGIRLSDQHMAYLEKYCAISGATPTGVINVLAESYVQTMIDRDTFYSPRIENFDCKELLLVAEEKHPYKTKKTPQKGAA
jgi:hypothetical protein